MRKVDRFTHLYEGDLLYDGSFIYQITAIDRDSVTVTRLRRHDILARGVINGWQLISPQPRFAIGTTVLLYNGSKSTIHAYDLLAEKLAYMHGPVYDHCYEHDIMCQWCAHD